MLLQPQRSDFVNQPVNVLDFEAYRPKARQTNTANSLDVSSELQLPKRPLWAGNNKQPARHYGSFAFSILLHFIALLVLTQLIQKKLLPEPIRQLMTVSLVEPAPKLAPEPEPEPTIAPMIKPVRPTLKPNKVKQRNVIAVQKTVLDDAPKNTEFEQIEENPVIGNPEPLSKPQTNQQQTPATAESVITQAEPEPKTEPPKFGVAYLNNPEPSYPSMSKRLGEEGRVLLKVVVDENGLAETVTIGKSSGYERLDKAALEAVQQWKFIPATKNNQPIRAQVTVPIKFSLSQP